MKIRFSSSDARRFGDGQNTMVVTGPQAIKFIVAIALFISLAVAALGYFIWKSGNANAAIMARGSVEVVATIEGLDAVRSETRNSSGSVRQSYSYYATVRYSETSGAQHVKQISIYQSEYESWQKGQTIALRYAVEDPTLTERRAGELAGGADVGFWIMGAGGLFAAVTGLITLMKLRRKPNVI